MGKSIEFIATYATPNDYKSTPLMLSYWFGSLLSPNPVADLPDGSNVSIWLTPQYNVSQYTLADYWFMPPDEYNLSWKIGNWGAIQPLYDFDTSPMIVAFERDDDGNIIKDDNGKIKPVGVLKGHHEAQKVFDWANGLYRPNLIVPTVAVLAAAAAYTTRKKWLPRLKRLV